MPGPLAGQSLDQCVRYTTDQVTVDLTGLMPRALARGIARQMACQVAPPGGECVRPVARKTLFRQGVWRGLCYLLLNGFSCVLRGVQLSKVKSHFLSSRITVSIAFIRCRSRAVIQLIIALALPTQIIRRNPPMCD